MKRFLMLFTIAITCLSLFATMAEAKRLGGGSSFGKQRSMPAQQAQKPAQAAPQPASPPPATPQGNRWLGPLAGLAIGAGLASMLSGSGLGGMGGMLGSIMLALLAGAVVMFIIARFKKPQAANLQYAGANQAFNAAPPQQANSYTSSAPPMTNAPSANIPADFPVDSFLRNGKASFIRLQAANDRKDVDDIREYTTPEMFAEISMQIQERDNTAQKTDVTNLNAELLEVMNEGNYMIASVRFTGQLSENKGAPENVDEIWHVQKDLRDTKAVWLLAGIQQSVTE